MGERAYEQIREAIVTLSLKPGQMVYEAELGARLGMSRTPVREGIRMLMMEEMIEVLPQRGMRVALISEQKVEEIRFVRESLEVSAFRSVARRWQSDQTCHALDGEVERLLQGQEAAAQLEDMGRFLELDEKFHQVFLEQTGNRTLMGVMNQMRSHLNRVRALSLSVKPHAALIVAEHRRIFEAVRQGRERETDEVLTHHLRRISYDLASLKEHFSTYFTAR